MPWPGPSSSWRRVGPLEHRTAWVARVAGNLAIDEVRRTRRRRVARAALRERLGTLQEVSLALDRPTRTGARALGG